MPPSFTIRPATAADISVIANLFSAYVAWLDLDLSFQSFSVELASLPGAYDPSKGGCLFLARSDTGEGLGCVGLRCLRPGEAELKRLYVTQEGRGMGVGRALVNMAMQGARDKGYSVIRLDTLRRMEGARRLYASLGFVESESYYDTPLEGTVFMELRL